MARLPFQVSPLTLIHGSLATVLGLMLALQVSATEPKRDGDVVSLGGSVTEIIYALGQDHRLIARDTTSTFPPEVNALPDVGYVRAI